MDTIGRLGPEDGAAAREAYEELATPSSVVATEVAKAMAVDDVRERVDRDVVATARDALFGSLLRVHVGTRAEFEDWREDFDGEVHEAGNPNVDNVAWHAFDGEAVAASFQDEREAAVATLRRQAFNRLYRELFYGE